MVPFARIEIGTGGLPVCGRCGGAPENTWRSAQAVCDEVGATARAWSGHGGANIWFANADAFGHPELPTLVECAASAGVVRVKVTTSGEALGVGQNAAGCLHAGVRHAEIALLGGSADVHDGLLTRAGAFDAALAGIGALRAAADDVGVAISITGRVVVCRHNFEEVPAAIATLARVGAHAAVVVVPPKTAWSLPAGWLAAVADTGVVNGMWVTFEGVDVTAHGVARLHARAPWDVLGGSST